MLKSSVSSLVLSFPCSLFLTYQLQCFKNIHIRLYHFPVQTLQRLSYTIILKSKLLTMLLEALGNLAHILFTFPSHNSPKSLCSSHTGINTALQPHEVVYFFRACGLSLPSAWKNFPLYLLFVCFTASYRSLLSYLPQRILSFC